MEQDNVRILPPSSATLAHLPTPLTSFIGRERDVTVVHQLLQEPIVRLLTLTGPGGVGKTRLGLAVAESLLPYFPDGIFFVPFASIRDPLLLLPSLASTLTIDEQTSSSPNEMLKVHLRHASALLLLDNFEHLLLAAPALVDLLHACPALKILVTSRAILRVQGEHVFEVLPLALPTLHSSETVERLLHVPAVQLFVERAQALKADFQLTTSNSRPVVEICTRLDGLPLALELAAARTNLLPPRTLLRLLEHRLPLLTTGGQDVHWRQQTLRNTLQWSYDLLTQLEQRLLCLLCIFAGGCTLEAVEVVSAGDWGTVEQLVDVLGSLVDKSFVGRGEQVDGELRLLVLETVREYGLACLQEIGEASGFQQRHADYFLALAQEAEPCLSGSEQLGWLHRLEQEHDNLRVALQWFLESNQIARALLLESALTPFWMMRNHMSEGHRWLEKALADSRDVPASIRAKALSAAAAFCFYQGENDKAATFFEESLELFRYLDDRLGIAQALNGLGHTSLAQHNYCVLQGISEENLQRAKEIGDQWKTAEAFFLSAYGYLAQGDYGKARAAAEECLVLARAFGSPGCMPHAIYAVGRIAYLQHDLDVAFWRYQETVVRAREMNEQWLLTACLIGLGEVAAIQGKWILAAHLWGAEEALHATIRARRLYVIRLPDEEAVAMTRSQLGERTFAETVAQGRAMTVEQVLLAQEKESPLQQSHRFSVQASSLALPSRHKSDGKPGQASGLTAREAEVLHLIAEGLTNPQIAKRLVVSPVTVNTHVRSIYSKLGISSRSAATRYVLEHPR